MADTNEIRRTTFFFDYFPLSGRTAADISQIATVLSLLHSEPTNDMTGIAPYV
jgi:hypothetical protein